MKPEDIEFQLSQLLDGRLDDQEAQALREKIAHDPALAEQYRQYQALEGKLGAAGGEEMSVDWDLQRESIHATLERQSLLADKRDSVALRVFRWSAAIGAAAAVIAGIALTLHVVWPSSGGRSIQVVIVPPAAPTPATRPAVATLIPGEPSGHMNVTYTGSGKSPDVKQARAEGPQRGMMIISGGSDADSAVMTLDLDDDL